MLKIHLQELPEFKGFSIITNQEELKNFLSQLRQDWYSPVSLEKHNFDQQLANWIKSTNPKSKTFFAVYDEKDDFIKNDGWGCYQLFRCVVIQAVDGSFHSFKSLIETFSH